MDITVSWKDSLDKEVLEAEGVSQRGATIEVECCDGINRYFPLQHVWYWQTPLSEFRTKGRGDIAISLMPLDNPNMIDLTGVETFCLEGETLLVVFSAGYARNYPLRHLCYWEVPSDKNDSDTMLASGFGIAP